MMKVHQNRIKVQNKTKEFSEAASSRVINFSFIPPVVAVSFASVNHYVGNKMVVRRSHFFSVIQRRFKNLQAFLNQFGALMLTIGEC